MLITVLITTKLTTDFALRGPMTAVVVVVEIFPAVVAEVVEEVIIVTFSVIIVKVLVILVKIVLLRKMRIIAPTRNTRKRREKEMRMKMTVMMKVDLFNPLMKEIILITCMVM